MKVKPGAVAVGQCYLTRHGDLRQVVSLAPKGEVTFDACKPLPPDGWLPPRRFHASLETFARELASEAPCPP